MEDVNWIPDKACGLLERKDKSPENSQMLTTSICSKVLFIDEEINVIFNHRLVLSHGVYIHCFTYLVGRLAAHVIAHHYGGRKPGSARRKPKSKPAWAKREAALMHLLLSWSLTSVSLFISYKHINLYQLMENSWCAGVLEIPPL